MGPLHRCLGNLLPCRSPAGSVILSLWCQEGREWGLHTFLHSPLPRSEKYIKWSNVNNPMHHYNKQKQSQDINTVQCSSYVVYSITNMQQVQTVLFVFKQFKSNSPKLWMSSINQRHFTDHCVNIFRIISNLRRHIC